jgi:hypothetical protein
MSNENQTKIVFERIKLALGVTKDIDLADFFEVLPQQLAQSKKRDTVPYAKIIEKAKLGKYHLDYVFLGVGVKNPSSGKFNLENKNEFESIVESKKTAALLQDLIKYGNDELYKNIAAKLDKIKELSDI